MSTIKTMTLDEAKKLPPMTEEELEELRNAPIVYDSDSPKLTQKQLEEFVPYYVARSNLYKPKKTSIHIRLDSDLVEAFKAQGKGYQSRINDVLRKYIFG